MSIIIPFFETLCCKVIFKWHTSEILIRTEKKMTRSRRTFFISSLFIFYFTCSSCMSNFMKIHEVDHYLPVNLENIIEKDSSYFLWIYFKLGQIETNSLLLFRLTVAKLRVERLHKSWFHQLLDFYPRGLTSLLQKLYSIACLKIKVFFKLSKWKTNIQLCFILGI